MIYHIAETTSTNDLAREERYGHGDVICAERQTAGRGQRGHTWTSAEGENLTFSLVLEPRFLPAGEQFLLSQAVALALTDTLGTCGIDTRIKWTNDIYAGDRKLVGILIEHSYTGPTLGRSVAGIGINVNQRVFDPALPNPVSMALAAGRTFDREEVLERFRTHCAARYALLDHRPPGALIRFFLRPYPSPGRSVRQVRLPGIHQARDRSPALRNPHTDTAAPTLLFRPQPPTDLTVQTRKTVFASETVRNEAESRRKISGKPKPGISGREV